VPAGEPIRAVTTILEMILRKAVRRVRAISTKRRRRQDLRAGESSVISIPGRKKDGAKVQGLARLSMKENKYRVDDRGRANGGGVEEGYSAPAITMRKHGPKDRSGSGGCRKFIHVGVEGSIALRDICSLIASMALSFEGLGGHTAPNSGHNAGQARVACESRMSGRRGVMPRFAALCADVKPSRVARLCGDRLNERVRYALVFTPDEAAGQNVVACVACRAKAFGEGRGEAFGKQSGGKTSLADRSAMELFGEPARGFSGHFFHVDDFALGGSM